MSAPAAESELPEDRGLTDLNQAAPTLRPYETPEERGGPRVQQPWCPPGFELLEELGVGGMGKVYKAREKGTGRVLALKVILNRADWKGRDRFRIEAQTLAMANHPHIVTVIHVDEHENCPYFTMELAEQGTLADRLGGKPIPAAEAAKLLEPMARAVEFLHRTIVHRDLKPQNILLFASGPKISDFGLAKLRDSDGPQMTRTGDRLGTPLYMAPEQVRGMNHLVGPRTDVYALGAILYEMLTGRPPFRETDSNQVFHAVIDQGIVRPRQLNSDIPRNIETICLKCLEKEPAGRYASAMELADDLRRYLQHEPIMARPASWFERAGRRYANWWRRKPKRTMFAHLVVPMLGATVLLGAWQWQEVAKAEQQLFLKRADTKRRAAERLQEADQLQKEEKYTDALARVRQAEIIVGGVEGQGLREDLGLDARLKCLLMVERLKDIRLEQAGLKGENFDTEWAELAYAGAFQSYGVDVDRLSAAEAARQIRVGPIQGQLIGALDDWTMVQKDLDKRKHLLDVLAIADDDAWRKGLRAGIANRDLATLRILSKTVDMESQPPPTLEMLGLALGLFGDVPGAVSFFRRAQLRHLKDLLINHHLARHLEKLAPPRHAEATGFYRVVQALYPDSPAVHLNLGAALYEEGKNERSQYDAALAAFREAVGRKQDYAPAHENIGLTFIAKNDPTRAILAFQNAIDIEPQRASSHYNQGNAYAALQQYENAVAAYQRAVDINPSHENAQFNLTLARYQATRSAALAAADLGGDPGKLTPEARTRLRSQALTWLRADLRQWTKRFQARDAKALPDLLALLPTWLQESAFAAVRDAKELAKLPAPEQKDWAKLWADVDELVKQLA